MSRTLLLGALGVFGIGTLSLAHTQSTNPADAWQLNGDVGIGINHAPVPEQHCSQHATAVPYLNAHYGPLGVSYRFN